MNEKKNSAVFRRILSTMLKGHRIAFLIVILGIVGSALATLKGTLFLQNLIDTYIVPLTRADVPDYTGLMHALFSLAAVYALGVLCSVLYNRIMVNIAQETMETLRIELFEHMESLPISYFDTHAHGDIMSVYTNDVDTLRQLISQSIPQVINSGFTVVTSLVSMIILNIPLTIITIAGMALMLFITSKISEKSSTYFIAQQNDLGSVNGFIEERMNGQKVVKVFCHEEKNLEEFRKLNEALRESADKANTFSNISMPINANLGNISYVVCAAAGAALALGQSGSVTLGALVSFLTLNKNATQPISQISQQLSSIVMAMAGAKRVFDLLDEEPESDDGYVKLVNVIEQRDGTLKETDKHTRCWAWKHPHQAQGTVTYQKLQGEIVFENVDFSYTKGKRILHEINLYARPGQKIALVGSTGAGKTTITNCINRFYDIEGGKIRYDGININKINKNDLRRSLGMVLQDTHLFIGTVMDNIRYGRPEATDEECIKAAELANADSFIRRLPHGYDTLLTSGGNSLSQGQRQLLSIARAALADAPVLILDEATSSIDTHTETLVQQGMDRLMQGRTSFVIAHRLSTVQNADCIMVMEHGRIIERGNHDQLMAQRGRYFQLYTGNALSA